MIKAIKSIKASDITIRMIRIIAITALVFAVLGAAFCVYRSLSPFPFILGTLLGAALTAVKLVMLERAIEKAVLMDEEKTAGNYIRLQYLFRLLLTGILLVLGALVPFISLWGVAAGLITLQIALFGVKRSLNDDDSKQDEKA